MEIIDLLGLEYAAWYRGSTNNNVYDAQKKISKTFDLIMQALAESDDEAIYKIVFY